VPNATVNEIVAVVPTYFVVARATERPIIALSSDERVVATLVSRRIGLVEACANGPGVIGVGTI
jgi:hypothetical protein